MGADEDGALHFRQRLAARGFEDGLHAVKGFGRIACLARAGEVIERQHGVRLAAAEIRLQADDGIAALHGEALNRGPEHARQAFRQVGDAEEGERIGVFLRAHALIDMSEIGRELRVGEAGLQNIRVRLRDLAPGPELVRRGRLLQPFFLGCLLLLGCRIDRLLLS